MSGRKVIRCLLLFGCLGVLQAKGELVCAEDTLDIGLQVPDTAGHLSLQASATVAYFMPSPDHKLSM